MKLASYLAAAACAGLMAGGVCGNADPVAAPGSATLLLKFKVGQTDKYDVVLNLTGTVSSNGGAAMPIDRTIDLTITQTVQSIDPQTGAATIKSDITPTKTTMIFNGKDVSPPAGQPDPTMPPSTATTVMEPGGKIDTFHMAQAAGAMMSMGFSANGPMEGAFYSPDKPVAVGDTWSRTTTGGLMGMNSVSNFKLTDLSKVNGDQIATLGSTKTGHISTTLTNPASTIMNGTFSSDQITLFDNTLGIVQSVTSTSHFIIVIATDTTQTPPPGSSGMTSVNNKVDITQKLTMTLDDPK